MIKHVIIILVFISQGSLWSQEYQLTNHADIRFGGGLMENLDTNVVVSAKSASIILGVAATGYAESPSGEYKTDMGFYSFYLKEPEAPTVHASKGAFSNKVQITWVQDVLSPPAYHRDNYDESNIFKLIKDGDHHSSWGPIDENSDFFNTHDGFFSDYEVVPGTNYIYEVDAKNSFGSDHPNNQYGPRGSDVGLVSPNGSVSGLITTPSNNPVPGIRVKVSPNLGKSILFYQKME